MKLKKIALIAAAGLMGVSSMSSAQSLDINGGFEDGLSGWTTSGGRVDISAREDEGQSAARAFTRGRLERTFAIQPNTNYNFRGRISDYGRIGITMGGRTTSRDVIDNGQSYRTRSITFNSGSNTSITIFAQHRIATSRFDTLSFTNLDGTGFGGSTGDLDPSNPPWENFDLREWALDTPAGRSGSRCRAERTEPQQWSDDDFGRTDSADYFFTHSDGGMRFVSRVGGATTGSGGCDDRSRSELREFLRGSNTNIADTGDEDDDGVVDFRNNWALEDQPSQANADFSWGARGGILEATLEVNEVTTSGRGSNAGRTIIGQIHAKEDEPLRLNYKSYPGQEGEGCIYASSETRGGDDTDFPLIGTVRCEPGDGDSDFGLGDRFSYSIEQTDDEIRVLIYDANGGSPVADETIILRDLQSGGDNRDDSYFNADEYMYFKAGVYTQNEDNTGAEEGEQDMATFYELEVRH